VFALKAKVTTDSTRDLVLINLDEKKRKDAVMLILTQKILFFLQLLCEYH